MTSNILMLNGVMNMKKIVCKDYDEMSLTAAREIAQFIINKPDCVLGLPTGCTPIGTYRMLVDMYSQGQVDFSGVKTFNLDEYYPIDKNNKNSYYYFMQENLFKHVNIKPENIHIPDGSTSDCKAECENYDKMIEESGGIDLQVLGVGRNGHIGFNEPDKELICKTHMVELTPDTIEVNSKLFDDETQMPRHALTMGMESIMKARKIILLISGESKADILDAIFSGKITTQIPATFLQLHPDVTVITDIDK